MTASRPDTWMPMYWGDYLKDTGHLSTEQHGAYLLLIGHYWTTGKPLPDDDTRLARIARLSLAAWKKSRNTVAEFFTVVDSKWTHGRIEEELEAAVKFLEKQATNGRKGGRPKKPIENPPHNPEDNPEETTSPSPSPSPEKNENPPQQSSLDAARGVEVRKRVEKILNSPTITMFNRVDAWLASGADPERDIYPTLEAGLKRLGGSPPRSLSYFDGMIADAIAARLRPLPAATARAAGSPKPSRGEYIPAAASSEDTDRRTLEDYAKMIKAKRNPGLRCTQVHIRKMLELEMITREDLNACSLAA